MSKKIYWDSMYAIIVMNMLGIVFQMSGMDQSTLFPVKKEIEEKVAAITRKLEQSGGKGEIALYNPETGEGSIFESELIPMSTTLKSMLNDLGGLSGAVPSLSIYSGDIISILHDILKKCQKYRERDKQQYAQKSSEIVTSSIQQFGFNRLISVLMCAYYLNIDKEIKNALLKETTDVVFDEKGEIANNNDLQQLRLIESNLDDNVRKEIMEIKWDIFLEKIKFSIAKNNQDKSNKKYFSVANRDNASFADQLLRYSKHIDGVLFSPDGKKLLIKGHIENIVNFPMRIIDTDGTNMRVLKDGAAIPPVWLNNNEIAYFPDYFVKAKELKIFNYTSNFYKNIAVNNIDQAGFFVTDMRMTSDNKVIFFYRSSPTTQNLPSGLGIFESQQTEISCKKIEGSFPATVIFNSDKKEFFLLTQNPQPFLVPGYISILYKLSENNALEEMKKIPRVSNIRAVSLRGDKIAMVIDDKKTLLIYFLDTKNIFEYKSENNILSLKFSRDGKMLIVGCENELIFLSAITGEKIDTFTHFRKHAHSRNTAVDLDVEGNMLAIGGDTKDSNLLIWKLIPNQYLPVFKELGNKVLSFDQINLFVLLYKQSNSGQRPVDLTDSQKVIFHSLNIAIQGMLTDIGYVAPGQMSEQLVQVNTSGYKRKIQPLKELAREILKSSNSYWKWLKANFSWDSLMKYLPSSG